jgi:hypothetical protein
MIRLGEVSKCVLYRVDQWKKFVSSLKFKVLPQRSQGFTQSTQSFLVLSYKATHKRNEA